MAEEFMLRSCVAFFYVLAISMPVGVGMDGENVEIMLLVGERTNFLFISSSCLVLFEGKWNQMAINKLSE